MVNRALLFRYVGCIDIIAVNVHHFIHNGTEDQCSVSCFPSSPYVGSYRARGILSDALSNIKMEVKAAARVRGD